MVCGFGDQVGYETLVRKVAKQSLDKTSRFTDWSRRPLTDAQKTYALADVTHLRGIYEHLAAELERTGRQDWVEEELGVLTEPTTYRTDPEEAWRRVKTRTNSAKFMAAVYTLARFREDHAQTNNVPRNRVFKDDALLELASTKPKSVQELGRSRLLLREARKGAIADGILAAIAEAQEMSPDAVPRPSGRREQIQPNPALADLLRVLLKAKCEASGVAQKLIVSAAELDAISAGERDLPVLRGWRAKVFGRDALRLCDGEIALGVKGQSVDIIDLT
jgi:ribonuclease D